LAAARPPLAAATPKLRLSVPEQIRFGEPFAVSLTVTNDSEAGFYFKKPWKWASNGLSLRATAEDGRSFESATLLYDIATTERCTFFKPLGPGDSYTFQFLLGAREFGPDLRLPTPGRYAVKWVYEARHYEDEESCATGGWPIWKGRAESPEVWVVVK
jgi:hypothetical protein